MPEIFHYFKLNQIITEMPELTYQKANTRQDANFHFFIETVWTSKKKKKTLQLNKMT